MAEAPDRALEIGDERAERRRHALRSRRGDDLLRGKRKITGRDAIDEIDRLVTPTEDFSQPDFKKNDA